MMVFIRFVVTGVLLLAFGLPSYFSRGGRLTMRDWGVFAFNGFFGIALSLGFFHFGINMFRNASSSAVVFSANAVFADCDCAIHEQGRVELPQVACDIAGLGRRLPVHVRSRDADLSAESCRRDECCRDAVCVERLLYEARCKQVWRDGLHGRSSLIGGFCLCHWYLTSSKGIVAEFGKVWDALPEMTYMVVVATAFFHVFYYSGLSRPVHTSGRWLFSSSSIGMHFCADSPGDRIAEKREDDECLDDKRDGFDCDCHVSCRT